jgi:hypothetical protein
MNRLTQFILISFIIAFSSVKAMSQTENITVIADQQMDTNTAFMQGFINGGASYNVPLTIELKPAFWGFGWDAVADYDYAVPNFNLSKMLSIYSCYMAYYGIGDPLLLQPWTDWDTWQDFVALCMNNSIATSRPVDYWSVWGEPDASFSGTPAQYIEMFRRTDSVLHAIQPSAKLVGPDMIDFGIIEIMFAVDSLHAVGVHPAAYSWHEFGNAPEVIPSHVQQFKDSLVSRPWAGNPQIHIQEYGNPDNRLIPGWGVGWLYYFEQAKIDWASRACFNEFDGVNTWDDCWNGLSGMYMMDGSTPQPLYWVHRAYADLNASGRVNTTSDMIRTIALADKNNATEEMKIIVGRYYNQYQGTQDPAANVQIKIKHYPYGNNTTQPLLIQRIPAQSVAYTIPLLSPTTVSTGNVTFTGDSAMINLISFADGDAYVIYINPDVANILSAEIPDVELNEVFVYPNPTYYYLMIATNQIIGQTTIFDIQGKVVYQSSVTFAGNSEVYIRDLANGIYTLQLTDETGKNYFKKFVKN